MGDSPDVAATSRSRHDFTHMQAETLVDVLHGIIRAGYPEEQIVVLTAYMAQKQDGIWPSVLPSLSSETGPCRKWWPQLGGYHMRRLVHRILM